MKLSASPSHGILTPGRPVPALTLKRQASGRVAAGVPILKVTGVTRPGKIPSQAAVVLVVVERPQQHASVSQGWICSDSLSAATLRQKLLIRLAISASHSTFMPGRILALTLLSVSVYKVATRVPILTRNHFLTK